MRHALRLLLGLLALAACNAAARADQPLRACADDAQWPPFSYQEQNGAMAGFTIELLRRIFLPEHPQLRIDPLPWKRCLVATESGDYQIAIDASANPERQRVYRLSAPYYQLHPYYFYSRRHFPGGLEVARGQDLARVGPVCGVLGYNYSNFALGDTPIKDGARDFYALAAMLHRGRCGVFIARFEIVAGMRRVGEDLLADTELGYGPIPDADREPFYLLISRNVANSERLKLTFDTRLAAMEKSGELQKLRDAYR